MSKIKGIKKSKFVKNVSLVMSATALAQIISFGLSPVISRMFEPGDFGVFGSFNSVLNVIAAGVTLQYSQAIMLPRKEKDAANVFALSILSVFAVSLIGLLAAYLWTNGLLNLLKAPTSDWLLWFLPLGVFVNGVNQSFQAWCVRQKAFKKTAASQVIRAGGSNSLQILTGFYRAGSGGLITSAVLANGFASINLAAQIVSDKKMLQKSLKWKKIVSVANKYRDFPLYSAPQNVMNALSQGIPVLFLAYFYGITVAGAYSFGLRILHTPLRFVRTALNQVLFQKASETYNNGGQLMPLFVKSTISLLLIGFIPSLILFVWAPELFGWIFGPEWSVAGEYVRWLVIWQMAGFSNLPSVLFGRILRQQRNVFLFEIFVLISRLLSLYFGCLYLSSLNTIILFSALGAVLNSGLIFWIGLLLFRGHRNRHGVSTDC